jgi:hypothetical protein
MILSLLTSLCYAQCPANFLHINLMEDGGGCVPINQANIRPADSAAFPVSSWALAIAVALL